VTDPEHPQFLGLPPEGYRDYGDPWPPPRPRGRLMAALHRLWAWLWAPGDPDARIHPDGGPGPYSGPYPWERPEQPLAGGFCSVREFGEIGWDDPGSDPMADMAAALDRAEQRYRQRPQA
jgi:hypothetical protein